MRSIKSWLVSIILISALSTAFITLAAFSYWYANYSYEEVTKLSKTISGVISQNSAKLILLGIVDSSKNNTQDNTAKITAELEPFSSLNSLVIYNTDKKEVYKYSLDEVFSMPNSANNEAKISSDLRYLDEKIGHTDMVFKTNTALDIFKGIIFELLFLSLFLIFFTTLLAHYYAKKFTKPITDLIDFFKKDDREDYIEYKSSTSYNHEYGYLYKETNAMLKKIIESQKSLKIAAVAFEADSGIMITDKNNIILDINKAFSTITGYTKEEVIGKNPSILKSNVHDAKFFEEMFTCLNEKNHWSGEIYNKHKNGKIYPEHLTIQTVRAKNGEITHYVASFIDLSLQKENENRLNFLKKYDSLTGLPNINLLKIKIQQYLDSDKKYGINALFCLDIKDFKLVNEVFSHKVGDMLLQKLSARLKNLEEISLIGKIDSNKFCLWIKKMGIKKNEAVRYCKIISQHIQSEAIRPYSIENQTINITVKTGIHIFDNKEKDASEIIKQSEIALHNAKRENLSVSFSSKEYQLEAKKQLDIYSDLINAIKEDQFELYYQFQFDNKKNIIGAEALIRWNHPKKGLIFPDDFISIAEKTNLIIDIGNCVIKKGCKQLQEWSKDQKTSKLTLSINISPKQFKEKNFVNIIKKEIKHIDAKLLKLEIIESISLDDLDKVIKKMKELKDLGVRISLDDFGTGYSSLQYLQSLPISQIKIDKSFVIYMFDKSINLAVIKSVIILGAALDIDVIVEGVETKKHFDTLCDLGIEYFQGYYFAKPKPLDELKLY